LNQRRVVRPVGRPTYGRQQSLRAPRRRRLPRLLELIPRRVLVLLGAAALLVLVLQQVFHVNTVSVKSPERVSEVQTEALRLIATKWSQQNLLSFSSSAFARDLLAADPMLKTVEVHRQWPNRLSVVATLKQPSLGWTSGNQAYLLDRDGSAIGSLPAGAAVPVVFDGSNLPVELGQHVTSVRFVDFTTQLAAGLAEAKVGATRLEVKDTTLDLYVTTNKGYQLIFDTSRPAAEELSDLKTLLSFLTKQNKAPASYIDLRIAGKAYYK
jgi:cell division septal protein FtsQ